MVRLALIRGIGAIVALALTLALAPAAVARAETGTFHFEELVTDPHRSPSACQLSSPT
jgi:hypothetical protein